MRSPIPSHGINCLALTYTTQTTSSLWRWNWYMVPKRRQITYWRRGNTQKNIYNTFIYCFLSLSRSSSSSTNNKFGYVTNVSLNNTPLVPWPTDQWFFLILFALKWYMCQTGPELRYRN
jgi:hypothetical protein